ncbi:HNH endonuclease family protein [Actinoplanes sp. NPDC023714]|uniref:HNH endonuclease family protein n=1 Tax=Actinoplanes sp. NPDC023714 TaxID=3154322 RepID=UPI0033E68A7D
MPRFIAPLVLTATLALTGCEVVDAGDPGSSTPVQNADQARTELDALTIAKAASMRGYSREKFPHWRDTGSNCDVRDSVLERDGEKVKLSGCNVVAGTWHSLYDDKTLDSPTKVDIDHTVPLANAWRSGAAKWDDDKRGDFANDLDRPQLLAVSATSNRSKGDQDPSTWKPPARDNWCEYAVDWVTVKSYWELTVTEKEKEALTDMLETC